jgi:hypothetical protein
MNPKSRIAAASLVAAGVLLAAGCGASTSSTKAPDAGGSANSPSPARYTDCMRSHGVPDYPAPDSSGQLPKITPSNVQQLGISLSRFNTAQTACGKFWPYQAPTAAQARQELADYLKFARCMRTHGLPGFPDPAAESGGPRFLISISKDGFNPRSAGVLAKAHECGHLLPTGSGLPEVTVTP